MVKKENLLLQATKVLRTSQKQFSSTQIGDTVWIQVPDVDHGSTDSQNVLAVVVGIEDSDSYDLANKNGTLKQLYMCNQSVICNEKLFSINEISFLEMSLKEAAAANLRNRGQDNLHCHFKKNCSTNKCSCESKGLLCNSKCHNSLTVVINKIWIT